MKTYEITYLTLQEEDHNAGTVAPILGANNAKIVSVHPWGARRKLAYPIAKQDQAFYTTVVFEADSSAVKPIEDALRLNNDVLRSLVVLFEPGYFHRSTNEESRGEAKAEKPAARKTEETAEQAQEAPTANEETTPEVIEAEAKTDTEEEQPKEKRSRKAAESDETTLDDKIDALLNEDIAK